MPARDSLPESTGTTTVSDDVAPRPPLPVLPLDAPAGTIPTQRRSVADAGPGSAASAAAAGLRHLGDPEGLDRVAGSRRRAPGALLVVLLCLLLVGAVATAVVLQLRADARATAWAHAQERVAAQYAAQQVDEEFWVEARAAESAARYDALVVAAVARAEVLLTEARAAAAAAPHAGDALTALQAATDQAAAAAQQAGAGVSLASLASQAQAVAAPRQAVVDAEAAWQAAEAARIAAERAAAERAAAEAAQRASATRSPAARAARPAATSGGAAPAAAAPAATAWAAGVASYGISGLGAEINAARAANGLGALSVVGSSTLANHAAAMAAAGSIWHSGSDHIVGWVEPSSDYQMIAAYLNSPSHRAWILKDGKSTVAIGAVTLNGRLYTAMLFS